MVIVTTCPSSTPDVLPVMSTPASALLALMMLSAAMAVCPAMALIAIVGGGGGLGSATNPELFGVIVTVATGPGGASFPVRVKCIGGSRGGTFEVSGVDA